MSNQNLGKSNWVGFGPLPGLPSAKAGSSSKRLDVQGVKLAGALEPGERGGIIFADIDVSPRSEGGMNIGSAEFDPDVVRGALLLFDRVDYPENNMLQVGDRCPPGLEGWSGFQRTRVELSGNTLPHLFEEVITTAFSELDARETGRWAVARGPAQRLISKQRMSPLSALQLTLQNALPLPDRSVPYDEVLSFKDRHGSELAALRTYLDELALEICRNGSTQFAETVAFEKLHRALADYREASRQANFRKRLSTVEVSFSFDDAAKAVLGGGAAAAAAGVPLLSIAGASIVAGLGASIRLNRHSNATPSPIEYVFKAESEM